MEFEENTMPEETSPAEPEDENLLKRKNRRRKPNQRNSPPNPKRPQSPRRNRYSKSSITGRNRSFRYPSS